MPLMPALALGRWRPTLSVSLMLARTTQYDSVLINELIEEGGPRNEARTEGGKITIVD